ncbi:Uncharacterized [Syntrophomonas zehnderi OL-4]|uniref:Uncharacterized n=2 Tax=Syntrophomonas TaxID=862 RepID=A0A0E4C7X0_9FIRM|nr:Uncharacterized [Syntrophomonas zehnderi OL-4]
MSQPLRRLELRLPVNHPVWSLPEGSRTRIVREWLEVGRRLTEIEECLKAVNEKLHTHNSGLNSAAAQEVNNQGDQSDTGFDKNTFLNYFK